ncbi:NUDIX domain-containing protein [Kineococcus radiotolerans]|uniref:NUDIX hydrolase n=1 Tax=Kineococcus radiotolerans (strain ATCC BAA-149 / DSM 14245 / SRS30216) TaxID=266940 RepID=A6W465_KINRD|nr:NUDIX domain-containing protein [Kineococcus radiotolerans]ABS01604.1 NUDIX hydrolase [Kineococcus radiotolerans SRS30216 = ATCC BAA-149]
MATRRSAGILLYRFDAAGGVELLVAHMGGPLWARKDEHAWSIPKGEPEEGEDLLDTAAREFAEELGRPLPPVDLVPLGEARQGGGKVVTVWAGELPAGSAFDADDLDPGTFTMEWPPRSGRTAEFPEVDRAAWSTPEQARSRLVKGQAVFVDRLLEHVAGGGGPR